MKKARKNVKWEKLNNKKLSKILVDCGLPRTSYRVLVWDIGDNIIGAVKRNGELHFIDRKQATKIMEMIDREEDE
jgi:hypothetical protein